MIRAHPWLGVGPGNVEHAALQYRGSKEFPDWMYQHMHNNLFQIAAEYGLPGLALWFWFMFSLVWSGSTAYRAARRNLFGTGSMPALMISLSALGVWIALFAAGMFEYNFGDSEVLIVFLFMTVAPSALVLPSGSNTAEAKPDINQALQNH
jgi:O-antigen ligase